MIKLAPLKRFFCLFGKRKQTEKRTKSNFVFSEILFFLWWWISKSVKVFFQSNQSKLWIMIQLWRCQQRWEWWGLKGRGNLTLEEHRRAQLYHWLVHYFNSIAWVQFIPQTNYQIIPMVITNQPYLRHIFILLYFGSDLIISQASEFHQVQK